MAKIGTLQVNTLHIADQAISGAAHAPISSSATPSVPVSVPNVGGLPVQLYFQRSAYYAGSHSNDSGSVTVVLNRVRDGAALYFRTVSWSGNASGSESFDGQVLDTTATTNETYTWSMVSDVYDGDGVPPRPQVLHGPAGFLTAFWYKK